MNMKCWIVIGLLVLVIIGGAYKFMIMGNVTQSADGRMTIHLTAKERDFVLVEMRTFLTSVQQITTGVSNKDMSVIAEAAKKVGMAAQQAVPGTLVGKLPIDFKKLGFDTHNRFDQLALDAESYGEADHSLEQLSTLMQNCVACHAQYRFDVVDE